MNLETILQKVKNGEVLGEQLLGKLSFRWCMNDRKSSRTEKDKEELRIIDDILDIVYDSFFDKKTYKKNLEKFEEGN